ncbi:MAG: hypothetical protein EXX96DRAFT_535442 [Benjaminiella poitrasii]|nr:MAG: hypothetical protein EXX96DRAFT_535442 [Benjaminiella poitrasii]
MNTTMNPVAVHNKTSQFVHCPEKKLSGVGKKVYLFREGLFVAVCQNKFRFPQNIKELPEFIHTLKDLEYLIERNEIKAIKLMGLYDKIYRSYNPLLNSEPSTSTCHRSYDGNMATMPTYYTSSLGDRNKSVILPQLFCEGKHQLFHERVIIGEGSPEAIMLEMKGAEDMFGWIEMDDNNCSIVYLRNKYAQKLSDEDPQATVTNVTDELVGFFTI